MQFLPFLPAKESFSGQMWKSGVNLARGQHVGGACVWENEMKMDNFPTQDEREFGEKRLRSLTI